MQADEKACPFCAETIKAAAIVCKHCGRDLPVGDTQAAPGANPIAGLPMEQQHKVRALGITWQQGRWVVDGCYFTDLARAIEFGERPRSAPAVSSTHAPSAWRWLWLPIGAGGLFLLFAMFRTPSPAEELRWRADMIEQKCMEDAARARVIMDCKEIRRIAEERQNGARTCPPEAPDCSWGKK